MKNEDKNKEILNILIKEYDIMRAEIRMYINKQYLALTAILAILSAGIFKSDPTTGGYIYVYIPFLVAGIVGFLSIVTFFVNRNAGYVRIIEQRINKMYHTYLPNECEKDKSRNLAVLFWENYYADVGMDRDEGNQLKSIFGLALKVIGIIVFVSLFIIVKNGFVYLVNGSKISAVIYVIASICVIVGSLLSFRTVNTNVRKTVREKNDRILNNCNLFTEDK